MIDKNGFTFETEKASKMLETYEWDNIWWEEAPSPDKDRVLIIGDSISCGYRRLVTEALDKKILVDGFGTSKSMDNPFIKETAKMVLSQEKNLKLILIGTGLHDWHLNSEEFGGYYEEFLKYLKELCPNVKIAILKITPVRKSENLSELTETNDQVIERNKALDDISKRFKTDIIDLYSELTERDDVYTQDGVHLKEEGYKILAARVAEYIGKNI